MSALSDYRRFSITISGFKTTHEARVVLDGFDKFRLYANAAIAELGVELGHQKLLTEDSEEYAAYQAGLNRSSRKCVEQAEAELVALRARRC